MNYFLIFSILNVVFVSVLLYMCQSENEKIVLISGLGAAVCTAGMWAVILLGLYP